jgi:hypothetical protein
MFPRVGFPKQPFFNGLLGDECQGWRLETLVRSLVHLAGGLSCRWRQWIACVMVRGALVELVTELGEPSLA